MLCVRLVTRGTAQITGLETGWFEDPYGIAFILMERSAKQLGYFRQWASGRGMDS
jgi:hypothetical protein